MTVIKKSTVRYKTFGLNIHLRQILVDFSIMSVWAKLHNISGVWKTPLIIKCPKLLNYVVKKFPESISRDWSQWKCKCCFAAVVLGEVISIRVVNTQSVRVLTPLLSWLWRECTSPGAILISGLVELVLLCSRQGALT